jgi:hypothetical protein
MPPSKRIKIKVINKKKRMKKKKRNQKGGCRQQLVGSDIFTKLRQ